jgi:hypothetical protein
VNVNNALTIAGAGYGTAKMINAYPSHTRSAIALGMGFIGATFYTIKNTIDVYKDYYNNDANYSSNNNDSSNFKSPSSLENEFD